MSDGKDKFAMSKSEPFISNTKKNIWSAGIHLPYKDNEWLSQIECYGTTKEEAEKLRDKVFDAMNATAQPADQPCMTINGIPYDEWLAKRASVPDEISAALDVVNDAANDARHRGDYNRANALVIARIALRRAAQPAKESE